MARLRALPAASLSPLADGIQLQAATDISAEPSAALIEAIAALPTQPRMSYHHVRFPSATRAVSSNPF